MERLYDMIVIGGGPAGYTAALYAARSGLSVLVLEKLSAGGQMALFCYNHNRKWTNTQEERSFHHEVPVLRLSGKQGRGFPPL